MSAESYGYILTKTYERGWVKSGQAIPLELYTPQVIKEHVEEVRSLYGPVENYVVVSADCFALLDEDAAENTYVGAARHTWECIGSVLPFALKDGELAVGFIKKTALVETKEAV